MKEVTTQKTARIINQGMIDFLFLSLTASLTCRNSCLLSPA